MIKFTVNSKMLERDFSVSIEGFLKEKGLVSGNVIVELNGRVLERDAFAETLINEGDTLEVIRAYAGG